MKNLQIYINKINENWIVDRLKKEFIEHNRNYITTRAYKSNLIWMIAPWTWEKVGIKNLKTKKVICTIHHIDKQKFNSEAIKDFYTRDKFVDFYHAPSLKTQIQLKELTDKQIIHQPLWINNKVWFNIGGINGLREKYGIPKDSFTIGSFQRDSEGSNVLLPKLSKGPDRFVEIIKYFNLQHKNLLIVLSGKRRDYVINELNKLNIKFKYFEMVDIKTMNELYNLLDLYIVASRYEGGPQSIFECAITKTPIISTDVGIANELLAKESIFDLQNFHNAKPNIEIAYKNVQNHLLEKSFPKYIEIFKELIEN